MKIAFLIRQLSTGGAEQQMIRAAVGLSMRGHQVTVFTFYSGGSLASKLVGGDVLHVSLDKAGRWDIPRFLTRLTSEIRKRRIDVLYTFLPSGNVIGGLLRLFSRTPRLACGVRASRMERASYDWLGSAVARIEDVMLRRADAVISNSRAGARRFEAWRSAGRVHVVHNGVDESRYSHDPQARHELRYRWGIPAQATLVGVVGRLDPMKGHELAMSAFALLRKGRPEARLVVIGDGTSDRMAALNAHATRLGLAQSVTFLPAMQAMPPVYSAIDVLLSSSIYGEGFSNVLCEALLCGCRCVATDVGDAALIIGMPEFVVPPRDAVALANALESAIAAGSAAPWQGARQRVTAQFSTKAMVDRTEEILSSLIGDAGSSGSTAKSMPGES